MRTRPLPNRHAADLSDFMECVQATLNRNRGKGDLGDMVAHQIIQKLREEEHELVAEMRSVLRWRHFWWMPPWALRLLRYNVSYRSVEHESADLAVCALAAWMWARRAEHVYEG